jgi:thioredoxin-like negative regulator of GroEL
MISETLLRLLVALGAILAGWAVFKLSTRAVLSAASAAPSPVPSNGHPSIIYFTTPDCAPCKSVQRPAILRLKQDLGEQFDLVEIDASQQPDLARQWGVLSVPTTFILDRQGKPLHVNHGVTRAEKLRSQIQALL